MNLPVTATFTTVLQAFRSNSGSLRRALIVPLALLVVMAFVLVFVERLPWENSSAATLFITVIIYNLVMGYFFVCIAVVVHRAFLAQTARSRDGWLWSKPHVQFAWRAIVVTVLYVLYSLFVGLLVSPLAVLMLTFAPQELAVTLTGLLTMLLNLCFAYVLSQWVLVLPAAAVGESLSTGEAYGFSYGNGLKLAILVCIGPLLAAYLLVPLADRLAWLSLGLVAGLTNLIWAMVLIFAAGILSVAYRELVQKQITPSVQD